MFKVDKTDFYVFSRFCNCRLLLESWSLEAFGERKPPILDPCLVDNQDSPFRFVGCSDSGFHLGEGGGQNKRVNLENVQEVLWRPM